MSNVGKFGISRRSLMRGVVSGTAVGIGLPFLDLFLNGNGTALASGAPLPVRFGTWFYGLGHTLGRGMKAHDGFDFEFTDECLPLEPYRKDYINYYSAFNTPLDGNPSPVHYTGWVAARTGSAPAGFGDIPGATFDTLIADASGGSTRFKSLEMTCTGNGADSYSYRSSSTHNAAETSPLELYKRLFGVGFREPNDENYQPDPRVILRQSVLSGIADDRKKLVSTVGSSDRERLDQYFTSVREVEQQLELALKAPELEACRRPDEPSPITATSEFGVVKEKHDSFSKILALALACDQTRIFNMMYSVAAAETRIEGVTFHHHNLTHQEPVDEKLGYQVQTAWLNQKSYEALASMIEEFSSIREGDGTLLDNVLIVAQTDTSDAKAHNVNGIPTITVGRAGGKVKTGMHINGRGGPITRLGLTAMNIMDVPISEWGTRSLKTSDPISEVIA